MVLMCATSQFYTVKPVNVRVIANLKSMENLQGLHEVGREVWKPPGNFHLCRVPLSRGTQEGGVSGQHTDLIASIDALRWSRVESIPSVLWTKASGLGRFIEHLRNRSSISDQDAFITYTITELNMWILAIMHLHKLHAGEDRQHVSHIESRSSGQRLSTPLPLPGASGRSKAAYRMECSAAGCEQKTDSWIRICTP